MTQYNKPNISLNEDDLKLVKEVLDSGWVSIGKYVEAVETFFKRAYKVKYAIGCSNATQGLMIAIKSAGWRNKRIAVPSFTWPSTIYAIESTVGNSAVFCDINRKTFNIDISRLPPDSYDAVVGVDVFGNECHVPEGKPIIYDAAHGFGLKNLGHRGLAEVVSFSFTKVVTAMEGGMILTNDDNLANIAWELRRLSSRMLEVNAIVLSRSILNHEENQKKKLACIETYIKYLDVEYTRQEIPVCSNHSVFPIILSETAVRDAIIKAFNREGIEYKVYYQPLVEGLINTDWVFSHILCLPAYPLLEEEEIKKICEIANKASRDIHVGHNYLRNSSYLNRYIRNS